MAHARSQRNVCKSVTWNFLQFQVSAPERWCGGAESREMNHTMPDGETSIKELVSPPPKLSCIALLLSQHMIPPENGEFEAMGSQVCDGQISYHPTSTQYELSMQLKE